MKNFVLGTIKVMAVGCLVLSPLVGASQRKEPPAPASRAIARVSAGGVQVPPSTSALELATADTSMTFIAGNNSPSVVNLEDNTGLVWKNTQSEQLIRQVRVEGVWQPVNWRLISISRNLTGKSITAIYRSSEPSLQLVWEWQARLGTGPIEHTIEIDNLDTRTVELPLQDSLAFNWAISPQAELSQIWVEKGAGIPGVVGTHEVQMTDPYQWQGASSTYAEDPTSTTEPQEPIPWMLVETSGGSQSGWYVGTEFSGRTLLTLNRQGSSLSGRAGLNPSPGPFLTRLVPGASFSTPTVFLGAFSGGSEAAGNILRRWVSHTLLNPASLQNETYPFLTNNTWGVGLGVNESKSHSMIDDAAALGMEMFHLDAGWFRGVGDWYADTIKFPSGIAALADYTHLAGMKFGLWSDWTQAGVDSAPGALNAYDPAIADWLTADPPPGWSPAEGITGITIDIGYAPARQWAASELDRLASDYQLDMLEQDGYLVAKGCTRGDHPHEACDASSVGPAPWLEGSCSTDVSYHATQAYYSLYEQLRRDHPGLLFEGCNNGGRMVDFGTAAHVDYFSITDTYDPLSNRRAFYDASHVLPPSMLESYVAQFPAANVANFIYALRSGMMGWCTVMQDTTAWTPEQHSAAQMAFQIYKTRLRPLIRKADLYHISARPNGVDWDGMEYYSSDSGQGVVYAFRGSTPTEAEHTFRFQGLRPDLEYDLHFADQTSLDQVISGADLMGSGVKISLPLPQTSELVFIQSR